MYLIDDLTNGQNKANVVGGAIVASCNRCAHENEFPPERFRLIQSQESLPGTRPPRIPLSKSSRKPLWKTYPNARAVIGVGLIEDRPKAAAIVARIVTEFADVEVQCTRLLAELIGTDIPAVAAVFGSLRSSRAQGDALNAAAKIALDDRDLELFDAYMARRAELEKERNDLAHGCFGIAVAIQDHIVWVAQSDLLLFTATWKNDPEAIERFRRKQYVYELGTLERIAQEIEEYYEQLGSFTGYLSARSRPGSASFRAERYPQLCNQPHIRAVLHRLRIAKAAAQAQKPKASSKKKSKS